MSENEVQNKYGASANEMSLKQKFAMYRECLSLPSEEERGAYCRQHQIYMADLESWGQEIEKSVNFQLTANLLHLKTTKYKLSVNNSSSNSARLNQKIKTLVKK